MKTIEENYSNPMPKCPAMDGVHRVNNYIKAKLIQDNLPLHGQVLDMPCGRGGDLKKYRQNKVSFYMGIDIVPRNIEEAKRRHEATRCMFGAHFMVRDFTQPLDLESRYDLVSCQFAMHYAWECEERARNVMRNAAERLKADGAFILTVPDYTEILRRLARLSTAKDDHNYARRNGDQTFTYRIGGEHYWLQFVSKLSFTMFYEDISKGPYGHSYVYYHAGAVDQVEEYLVEPRELERIAGLEGLRISSSYSFSRLLERPDQTLLGQMRCSTDLSDEGREVVALYRAVVLRPVKRRRE